MAGRSKAKRPAVGAAATVEAVASRLLALPQPGGQMPTLWRKTDLGRELSDAEKEHFDAALARLQDEGRLVALAHGESVYFVFADVLRERLGLAPVPEAAARREPPTEELMTVYRRLVRESGGFPDVKISLLARALGPEVASGLPARLMALWRTGDATLSLGDWSLASEETRAVAVEMDGEKYLLVRFEEG